MNTSINFDDLTPIEQEITEMYSWGMTKKEIAAKRKRSVNTIGNQIRKLFEKTDTRKDTEFAAWYFCSKFKISFNLSPMKQAFVSICLLLVLGIGALDNHHDYLRARNARSKTTRTVNARRGGRSRGKEEY